MYKFNEYEINESVSKTVDHVEKYTKKISRNLIKKCLISDKVFEPKKLKQIIEKFEEIENKYYTNKIKKAKETLEFLNKNKNIIFIGISGSVAIGEPDKNDDIDLIIITKSNKLWQSRFYLRQYFYWKKIPHRKYKKIERNDEFCFNLWLDENALLIPKDKRNLRNAIDLVNIVPVINKKGTYEKFLYTNKFWAKKFVANQFRMLNIKEIKTVKDKDNNISVILNFFWYLPQKFYISLKKRNNLVTKNQAFFHKQ